VIRQRLESYIIADDVVVQDATAEWAGVSLLGREGPEAVAPPPKNNPRAAWSRGKHGVGVSGCSER
jgi:hypothetical protein